MTAPDPTPLEDYALLGDRRTAALVSRRGSVDWWCVPRFDAGACFAAILGTPADGRFLLAPADDDARSSRRYREGTMVLETDHHTRDGVVRVIDCLAVGPARPLLVRVVEGLEGRVRMRAELVVRFDYGAIVPWARHVEGAWRAIGGPDGLELRTPVRMRGEGLMTVAEIVVDAGERVPFVLGWFPSHDPRGVSDDADALVDQTARHWQAWSSRCRYDGDWHAPVVRSLLTLESLTYAPTGGIVAAPTTSLPETLGGSRNWDYRYCWVRDATLTLEALLICGYRDEALRWRQWLLRAAAGAPKELQTLYGVAGERRLTEIELGWLAGYGGARPVRIGNAAHSQLQLDVYGELADVLCQAMRGGVEVSPDVWAFQQLLLDELLERWKEPDEGIWEVRGPRRHFTHSKVMCWVAFDRSVAMAERAGLPGPVDTWRTARDEIHRQVCDQAYDARREAFVQAYDSDLLDASALMIPLVGFLPATDERVLSTIDAIRRDLTVDGLVRRYDPTAQHVDGIGEDEGVFLPCSFWLVEALALAGRRDEAGALFERLLGLANDVGLYAEEYDPHARRFLGNFPQAFTHLTLVGAAHTLRPHSAATQRRRRDRHARA